MRVRPVTAADLAELGRGFKVVVDEKRWLGVQPPVTAEGMADWLGTRLEDGRVMIALEDSGGGTGPLVGLIDLHPTRTEGVHALGMWILPDHRGKGGGRMLLEAAIDARPADVHKIELEVWPHNEPAIGLYERAGFEREGLRRDHYRRRDGRLHSSVIHGPPLPRRHLTTRRSHLTRIVRDKCERHRAGRPRARRGRRPLPHRASRPG